MEYLLGSKQDFFDFVDSIGQEDKIAILSHTDLDGLASAVFLEKILEVKGLKAEVVEFVSYGNGFLKKKIEEFKERGVTKIFISDLGLDSSEVEDFNFMRQEFDVFLIDHHPLNKDLENKEKIIKTGSEDCSALCIYDLLRDLDSEVAKEWEWLVAAAIFSDMSYKNPENLKFLQGLYPEFPSDENLMSSSKPGITARKIACALIYFKDDLYHVFDLIKEKNIGELERAFEVVESEVERLVEEFSIKSEFFPERNLYFYEIKPKFNVASFVCTLVSKMKPEFSFICISDMGGDFLKASARNQSKSEDMNVLMKKGVAGLEEATGGGHVPAAACKFRKEDLQKFKENILKE